MTRARRSRPATALGLATLGTAALLAFTPAVGALHAALTEPAAENPRADAVVVLGAGLQPDGDLGDHSLRRTVHGIRLLRRGAAPLIVLLGPPHDAGIAEADARAALAADLGVPAAAVEVERAAYTTREEAARVKARLFARGLRRIVLVTGAHHMPRARRAFEAAGLEVVAGVASERSSRPRRPEDRLVLAWVLLQEAAARAYYRLAGAF
jgi:uncharacterized SAM-binding protein YcdF (DUF218 family)